ncbi:hypothetical protein UCDDA912_g04047 [Diaporthe ampelina]|uniref:Uncharacterized protein n=1 Tax=Diaporthe ampelina TaxID=1214573 RepID=A0A0G2FPI6_9PEZI|nr:hypothetical protein UCDDA912_g04047 [Diaporthe ampelina]
MSDVFRRIGRGGAGNFIPEKEIQDAERAKQAHDPESQKNEVTAAPPPASAVASHPPQYVRVGRGGSGNYTEPPTIAESQDRQDVVERTKAAVSASQAGRPRAGFSSRGGAGNWTDDAPADDSEESSKRQEIADKVKQDINSSLPPPPRTYHQHDRDME